MSLFLFRGVRSESRAFQLESDSPIEERSSLIDIGLFIGVLECFTCRLTELPRVPEQGTGGTGGARCTMVQPPARTSGTGTSAPRLPARWYTVRTRTVCAVGPSARLSRDRLPCDSPIEATTPF